MESDKAVEIAAALARRFEGFRSHPYLCPAGVATIGYGATHYPDGAAVTLRDAPISAKRAEIMLQYMIKKQYLPAVLNLCPGIDTPERLAAITDFAFNLGIGRLKASTLRRRINAGRWELVPDELMKWTRGGGKVLKGLVARRQAEAGLI